MKNTVIFFDLDGTLVDSTSAILESVDFAFKHFNRQTPEDNEIKALIGYPLEIIFTKLGVSQDKAMEYVDTYKIYYKDISIIKTKLLQNAKESILLANSFAHIGIVTTKNGISSKRLLDHFGVLQHFDVVVGRENVLNPKPSPEPIYKALESLKSIQDNVWMVGDTILDAKAAINAKVNIASVLCGYGKESDLREITNNIFLDTLEAVKFIQNKRAE